jgi:hypothetical protein
MRLQKFGDSQAIDQESLIMQDLNGRPVCHRAEDLVTYLYGESSESDALDFRAHTTVRAPQ